MGEIKMPVPQLSPISVVTLRRPLVSVETAVETLDVNAYKILELIESGALRFAWNFAAAGASNRYIRILAVNLVELQSGQAAPVLSAEADWQRTLKIIFPAISCNRNGVRTVRVATIARRFSVKGQHILNLLDAGVFRARQGTTRKTGPNGSPEILFDSVVAFLKSRRLL